LLDETLNLQQHLRVSDLTHNAQCIGAKVVVAPRHVLVQAGCDDENYIGGGLELLDQQVKHASQTLVRALEQLGAAEEDVLASEGVKEISDAERGWNANGVTCDVCVTRWVSERRLSK
jgi:hypothetical protein